jgi:hypothetical protein
MSVFLIFYFNSISGGRSPTGSTRHVDHQLSYCTCPGWLWGWRNWWNDDWQGKPKYSEETCASATLSNTNLTWPDWALTRAAAVGNYICYFLCEEHLEHIKTFSQIFRLILWTKSSYKFSPCPYIISHVLPCKFRSTSPMLQATCRFLSSDTIIILTLFYCSCFLKR